MNRINIKKIEIESNIRALESELERLGSEARTEIEQIKLVKTRENRASIAIESSADIINALKRDYEKQNALLREITNTLTQSEERRKVILSTVNQIEIEINNLRGLEALKQRKETLESSKRIANIQLVELQSAIEDHKRKIESVKPLIRSIKLNIEIQEAKFNEATAERNQCRIREKNLTTEHRYRTTNIKKSENLLSYEKIRLQNIQSELRNQLGNDVDPNPKFRMTR